jgi:hypothetical protein
MQQSVSEYNQWCETEPAKAAIKERESKVIEYRQEASKLAVEEKAAQDKQQKTAVAAHKADRDAAPQREAAEKLELETRTAKIAAKVEQTKREKILKTSGFDAILARVESEKSKLEHESGGLTRHRAADALSTCMQKAKKYFIEGKGSLVEDRHVFQGTVFHGVEAAHPPLKSERWDDVFAKIMSAIISLGGLIRYGTGRETLGLFSGKVDLSKKLDKLLVDFKTEFEDVTQVAPSAPPYNAEGSPVVYAKAVLQENNPDGTSSEGEDDVDPYQKT